MRLIVRSLRQRDALLRFVQDQISPHDRSVHPKRIVQVRKKLHVADRVLSLSSVTAEAGPLGQFKEFASLSSATPRFSSADCGAVLDGLYTIGSPIHSNRLILHSTAFEVVTERYDVGSASNHQRLSAAESFHVRIWNSADLQSASTRLSREVASIVCKGASG
jgi:hypothetical protein